MTTSGSRNLLNNTIKQSSNMYEKVRACRGKSGSAGGGKGGVLHFSKNFYSSRCYRLLWDKANGETVFCSWCSSALSFFKLFGKCTYKSVERRDEKCIFFHFRKLVSTSIFLLMMSKRRLCRLVHLTKKSVFEKRTVVANKWSWQNFRYQFQSGNLEIFQYERKFYLILKASRILIWKWFGYSLSFQFLANTSISLLQIFFIKWAWRTTPIKKSSYIMLTLLQISERKISFFAF